MTSRAKRFFSGAPDRRVSESLIIGAILAVVGGFLDAYTYISRGGVFANAQTGNIVLLGINLAQGRTWDALRYVFPIAAFIAGIIIAEVIRRKEAGNLHWRQIVILIEMILVTGVSFIEDPSLNYLANISVAFACSLQVQSFRMIQGTPFATTMCTGNLRTGTQYLCRYFETRDRDMLRKFLEYFSVILFFIIGACIGTVVTNSVSIRGILFCDFLLLAAFILLFSEEQ